MEANALRGAECARDVSCLRDKVGDRDHPQPLLAGHVKKAGATSMYVFPGLGVVVHQEVLRPAALRQLAAWQRHFELPDLSIAINLSSQQLMHSRLVQAVSESLSDTMLDPGCIELEISDGDIVYKRTDELETLRALRKLGVRISLDNFGTREVSFESLDEGFVDSFVLDQSLISDIEDNSSHQRIVRAAIAMAQGLDIEVAAEGVETMTQLEFLKSCNCDLAQGFLISKPMRPENVSAILRSEIAGTGLLARGMP